MELISEEMSLYYTNEGNVTPCIYGRLRLKHMDSLYMVTVGKAEHMGPDAGRYVNVAVGDLWSVLLIDFFLSEIGTKVITENENRNEKLEVEN